MGQGIFRRYSVQRLPSGLCILKNSEFPFLTREAIATERSWGEPAAKGLTPTARSKKERDTRRKTMTITTAFLKGDHVAFLALSPLAHYQGVQIIEEGES
jgi:hypothetical protein